jgi:hypothetical protein
MEGSTHAAASDRMRSGHFIVEASSDWRQAFRIEYSRFILGGVAVSRRLFFAVFVALAALLTAGGVYLRHRAITAAAAADCATPAPPPKTATPPPKLPDFQIEAGCGVGNTQETGRAQNGAAGTIRGRK